MALRGITPKLVEKRLKMLLSGPAGVGKTTAAIQFPTPYLIDTERGAENDQYVSKLQSVGGAYFFTADFEELLREVTGLLTERHTFRTLVIDPLTVPYADLLDKSAQHLATKSSDPDSDGTEFGRHKAVADRKVKRLLNLLVRLDMNVVITSHAKTKWEKVGDQFKEAGTTFDCYAKLDYVFDLWLELQERGSERWGVVRKTRLDAFPKNDAFNFSYDAIAERYGRHVLEKGAVPVEMASPEQVAEIARLVELLNAQPVAEKWLAKADADSFTELPRDIADKCLGWLHAKIANTDPADAA